MSMKLFDIGKKSHNIVPILASQQFAKLLVKIRRVSHTMMMKPMDKQIYLPEPYSGDSVQQSPPQQCPIMLGGV